MSDAERERDGYCNCGCGQETTVPTRTDRALGMVKGRPMLYVQGHSLRRKKGEEPRRVVGDRYVRIYRPEHPNAKSDGCVYEHTLLASEALGGAVPDGAEVHHVNGDGTDNSRGNLVLCENQAYHGLLHRRSRAMDGYGDPNAKKCWLCQSWDDPDHLVVRDGGGAYHSDCRYRYYRMKKDGKSGEEARAIIREAA